MKKHIMLLMAIVCMFAMLTGCVQQDIGVAINADGTGTVSATIGIEEDAYEQLVGMGSDIFEGKETSTYEHDGKTYVSYTETKSYENYEDIEKALLEMTYESDVFDGLNTEDFEKEDAVESAEAAEPAPIFKSVSIDKSSGLFYSNYTFKAEMNPQEISDSEDIEMDLPIDTDSFRMTFTITMPSDITQASGGTVEENKAVFEIDDITEAQEFSVISEQNNIVAVVVIVVVLVIILGLFFFLTKRKG